jgi:hypothetical protein
MTHDIFINFTRPILAIGVAGVGNILSQVTPPIQGVPQWITELGLPIASLCFVIYALVFIHRALRSSEQGRISDAKEYANKLEAIIARGQDTRERLIAATTAQTLEFKNLADQLRNFNL